MGCMSAMNSLERVLELHGDEIREELLSELAKQTHGVVVDIELENNVYSISVTAVLSNDTRLGLPPLDIDSLAEDYPDCRVGY